MTILEASGLLRRKQISSVELVTAARAFNLRILEIRSEWLNSTHAMLLDRIADLTDTQLLVLAKLLDLPDADLLHGTPDRPAVIVARELTPSVTVRLDPGRVLGFVTGGGTRTSHASILCRSLGLPAVVGVGDAVDEIAPGTECIVDGLRGRVILQPTETERERYRERAEKARSLQRELRALERAAAREPVVIATGGGAPTIPAARPILGTGFVVWLAVSPAVAAQRILAAPGGSERPLLAGDPRARLEALLQSRIDLYRGADAAVDCDDLTPEEQAEEIERLWYEWQRDPAPPGQRFYSPYAAPRETGPGVIPEPAAIVTAPGGTYPVLVGEGALGALGAICRDLGLDGRALIITDTTVGPLFAARAGAALESAGYTAATFAIPAGEEHKNLQTLAAVYDFLIDHRIERTDFIVTLGGGVVTDLAGFAAATILRGVPFLHAPTSLLAMADAAIGGKTGIDHPRGKNLIGAFAQPRAVVIDPLLLRALPDRQLRNG
ncbi:MAG: iron-containing alcohol dehydrogenase, partial [Dehalococcoidia bacterium]|nr:iron-containing alcohol dehydrogenase [Dehalococcoidia bacterium]